jgi:hypothetical protein
MPVSYSFVFKVGAAVRSAILFKIFIWANSEIIRLGAFGLNDERGTCKFPTRISDPECWPTGDHDDGGKPKLEGAIASEMGTQLRRR